MCRYVCIGNVYVYDIRVCRVRETSSMHLTHVNMLYTGKTVVFLFSRYLHSIVTATNPSSHSRTPKYTPISHSHFHIHIPLGIHFFLFSLRSLIFIIYIIYMYVYIYMYLYMYIAGDNLLCIIHRNRCRNELLWVLFFFLNFRLHVNIVLCTTTIREKKMEGGLMRLECRDWMIFFRFSTIEKSS